MNVEEAAKLKLFIIIGGKMVQRRCFYVPKVIRMFNIYMLLFFFFFS